MKKIERLESVKQKPSETPLLSVIVAARDEEASIEKSLRSQLKQTYKQIEWIVVNDRSNDATGEIIDLISKEDPRFHTLHITSLDKGWLGKNHALYRGYLKAKGEYLLFTDADILYHPKTIEKAISYVQENQLDHLTLAPNMSVKRFWPKAFVTFFLFGFSFFKRPWKANDDKSKTAIGIGAFNLVKRTAYEKIGTHRAIKERPDDDLMLGIRIKGHGYKQRMLTALSFIEVEWYATLKDAFIGLEKNTFAGLHYRYSMVWIAVTGVFTTHVIPFITLFFAHPLNQTLSLVAIGLIGLLYIQTVNRMTKGALKSLPVFPITALLFLYCIARAAFLTAKRGGIMWRGTFYSMKDLRK